MTEYALKKQAERRTRGKWLTLAAVVYALLITVFFLALPSHAFVLYLVPAAFLHIFLLNWFEPGWLILLLAALPVLGWLLLRREKKAGKPLIVIPQIVLLLANLVITPFHFFQDIGVKSLDSMKTTILLALPGLLLPILTLIFLHWWHPKH